MNKAHASVMPYEHHCAPTIKFVDAKPDRNQGIARNQCKASGTWKENCTYDELSVHSKSRSIPALDVWSVCCTAG